MVVSRISTDVTMIINLYRYCLRLIMVIFLGLLRLVDYLMPRRKNIEREGLDILLTGTFYSANWLIPHLQPLAAAKNCRRVRMVACAPVPVMAKVEPVYPPQLLCRIIGEVPARLLIFSWLALKDRPQVIGGFHLLLNGLFAILLARMLGVRSLYICGGGEREVSGGGYQTENRIFKRIGRADAVIERQLLKAVQYCDLVVVMGSEAADFFKGHGVPPPVVHIMPGGFDQERFQPSDDVPRFDLITVGRLSAVKRVDLLLETIALLQSRIPSVSALVVGDGPEKDLLEQQACNLGVSDRVCFAGHQDRVEDWLRQAAVFVLCSDSEGVSQAMIQAMLCGLPAVVSNVGDLKDVVTDGENGFLVSDRTPREFAESIAKLLSSPERLAAMRCNARKAGEFYSMSSSSTRWVKILDTDCH